MNNTIRILHLSDLHYNARLEYDFDQSIIRPLLDELAKINSQNAIDIVCITGDLIDKGNAGCIDTKTAFCQFDEKFIIPLMKCLSIPRTSVFFVPGNHDVNRNLDSKYIEAGLKESLITEEAVNDFIDKKEVSGTEGIQRVVPFKEQVKRMLDRRTSCAKK